MNHVILKSSWCFCSSAPAWIIRSFFFGSSHYIWDTLIETHSHTDDTTWGNKQSVCFSQTPPGWNGCFSFFPLFHGVPAAKHSGNCVGSDEFVPPCDIAESIRLVEWIVVVVVVVVTDIWFLFWNDTTKGSPSANVCDCWWSNIFKWLWMALVELLIVNYTWVCDVHDQAWFVTRKRLISFKKRSRMSPKSFGKRWKEEFLFFISGIWTIYMGVFKNSGIPKSSILIGFSIINHLFWGTPIFGNTHIIPWRVCYLAGHYMHPETSQFWEADASCLCWSSGGDPWGHKWVTQCRGR